MSRDENSNCYLDTTSVTTSLSSSLSFLFFDSSWSMTCINAARYAASLLYPWHVNNASAAPHRWTPRRRNFHRRVRSQQWAMIELFLQVNRSYGVKRFFAVSKLFRIVIGDREDVYLTGRRCYYEKKKKKKKKKWEQTSNYHYDRKYLLNSFAMKNLPGHYIYGKNFVIWDIVIFFFFFFSCCLTVEKWTRTLKMNILYVTFNKW